MLATNPRLHSKIGVYGARRKVSLRGLYPVTVSTPGLSQLGRYLVSEPRLTVSRIPHMRMQRQAS